MFKNSQLWIVHFYVFDPISPLFWAALAAIVGFCTLFMAIYVYHDWSVGKWKICFHIWCVMMIHTCSCLGSTSVCPRSAELGCIVRLCKNISGYECLNVSVFVLILPQTNMTFFTTQCFEQRALGIEYKINLARDTQSSILNVQTVGSDYGSFCHTVVSFGSKNQQVIHKVCLTYTQRYHTSIPTLVHDEWILMVGFLRSYTFSFAYIDCPPRK